MTRRKDGTPAKGKCTDIEHARRLVHVADLLCDGLGLQEISKDKSIITWGVERIQIGRYIKEAWKEIHDYMKMNQKEKVTKAVAERDRLKVRAILKKDYSTALKAMDSRDKIEGILREREPGFLFSFKAESLTPQARGRLEKEMSIVFGDDKATGTRKPRKKPAKKKARKKSQRRRP